MEQRQCHIADCRQEVSAKATEEKSESIKLVRLTNRQKRYRQADEKKPSSSRLVNNTRRILKRQIAFSAQFISVPRKTTRFLIILI